MQWKSGWAKVLDDMRHGRPPAQRTDDLGRNSSGRGSTQRSFDADHEVVIERQNLSCSTRKNGRPAMNLPTPVRHHPDQVRPRSLTHVAGVHDLTSTQVVESSAT